METEQEWMIGQTAFFMRVSDMPDCCRRMVDADLGFVEFTCPICGCTWSIRRETDQ